MSLATRPIAVILAASALAAGLASCGGKARTTAGVHPVEVVASVYPLAQMASYIGGKDIRVVDLAAPGVQPEGLQLTTAQLRTISTAPLLLDVGYGYQPQVETAPARRRLSLLPALTKRARPYQFWLDPSLMFRAAPLVAKALAAVDPDPAAQAQFANGARDLQSVASSLESDFQANFSQCAQSDFVSADGAFQRMAIAYGLTDISIAAVGVSRAAALVAADHIPIIFSESGIPSGPVLQVAQATGVPVKVLDPLEIAPPSQGPAPESYFTVMERDLTTIEDALACDTSADY
jgi:zinc transport system substrate-binding protein